MQVICAKCNQPTDARIQLRPPQTINLPAVSVVIMEHPEQFACDKCGAILVPGIAKANLVLVSVAVPKPAEKPVIVIPGRC